MGASTSFHDTSWAFPWERRQHTRFPVDLPVRIHGPRGDLPARTVNVSLGGAMLGLREGDLCTVPPLADRSVLLTAARGAFGAHLEVAFLERGVTCGARLARMLAPPDERDRLLLGIRFLEPLSPHHLKRLGIPSYLLQTPDAEAPASTATAADPRTNLWVALSARDEADPAVLASGPLLGVADRTVAFRDREGDAAETVARLAGRPLTLSIREGTDPVWSAGAHFISVRVLSSLGDAVEATVLTGEDPRPALADRLLRGAGVA